MGLPLLVASGQHNEYWYIAMRKLGKSLSKVISSKEEILSLKSIIQIGI